MCYTLTVHLNLDQPQFKCSRATYGWWLLNWMVQACELPGAVLNALNVETHFTLTTILQGKHCHYSHFIDEELTEQRPQKSHASR